MQERQCSSDVTVLRFHPIWISPSDRSLTFIVCGFLLSSLIGVGKNLLGKQADSGSVPCGCVRQQQGRISLWPNYMIWPVKDKAIDGRAMLGYLQLSETEQTFSMKLITI